jgi:protein-tyrosine phosphatase
MWPFSHPKLRVLVVCTANVCRSPAAEALLRQHLRALGAHRRIAVASAGTDVGAPGRTPDPRVIAIAAEKGVSLRGIRATPLSEETLNGVNLVYVMEGAHLDAIRERFPGCDSKIMRFDPSGVDIPDPYYGSKDDVRRVVEQIDAIAAETASLLYRDVN